MDVIFNNEDRININQADSNGAFNWSCSNEIYEDDCLMKIIKFLKLFMIWCSFMSFKEQGEMKIIFLTINAQNNSFQQ